MAPRVLVTGASGYIGSRVAAMASSRGWEVHALVRGGPGDERVPPGVIRHRIDERDLVTSVVAAVRSVRPSATLNLAAMVRGRHGPGDIEPMIAANVTLGVALAEGMTGDNGAGGVLVSAGTYWEYGPDGSYAPNSLYAGTKRALRDALAAFRSRGLVDVTLVLFDVYGPGDWRGKLWPTLLDAARRGGSVAATPGTQRLDLVHLDDVARGFLRAAELGEPGVFALDSGVRPTLREAVETLERVTGVRGVARWGEAAFPAGQIHEPVSGLPRLPGWRAEIGFERGIREAWEALARDGACETPGRERA